MVENIGEKEKEQIIQMLADRAGSYVPEWRFDPENPDIGSALMLVYEHMYEDTLRRFQMLPKKNMIAFYNALGAKRLPALPSSGYASFSMVNSEVGGQEMEAGVELVGSAEKGQQIFFETTEDMYVTPAKPACILFADAKEDYISQVCQIDPEQNQFEQPAVLFSKEDENLQRHSLYFYENTALVIKGEAKILLEFRSRGESVPQGYLEAFLADSRNTISYYSDGEFVPFEHAVVYRDRLLLTMKERSPKLESVNLQGQEGYYIRMQVHDWHPYQGFLFDEIGVSSSCERKKLEAVYSKGVESRYEDFFPFGERFSDYDACYFSSDEVFGKRGARVRLSFNLDFVKIPIDLVEDEKISWQWIMRRSDFRPNQEYDITVEEVVWEYYNGQGWAPLFEHRENEHIFSTQKGTLGQYRTLSFVCPGDIAPILINAYEACAIRVRVTKVNNLYKLKGYYVTPIMGNVSVDYDYGDRMLPARGIFSYNNMECRIHNKRNEMICPFYGMNEEESSLYVGFELPPLEGPIRIWFDFLEQRTDSGRKLVWEYYNGREFVELDVIDETFSFARSGLVTILGKRDYAKKELFDKTLYWIRIVDQMEQGKDANYQPKLLAIFMNTVRVRQRDAIREERFHIKSYQEDMFLKLQLGNVLEAEVYIDELGHIGQEETEQLKRAGLLKPVYREDGIISALYVKWECQEEFLFSKPGDRHFVLDANEGIIRFGNGKNGRIPPTAKRDNIWIRYMTGGGELTNIPMGSKLGLSRAIGYIGEITNPVDLSGGQDSETIEDAQKRNATLIRSQNIAIAKQDYESLCKLASRRIRQVKCFTGVDAQECRRRGAVTLVVLTENLESAHIQFGSIKTQIEQYMKERMDQTILRERNFFVIPPVMIEYRVYAELVAENMDDIFQTKKLVSKRLEDFLNPLTGNFDHMGWQIGTLPNMMQLENVINDIRSFKYIRKMTITAYRREKAAVTEVDLDQIRHSRYVLPVSGRHEIVIRMERQ